MSTTTYLDNGVLNYILNNTGFISGTLYVGLFTADPTDTGALTDEVSGGSYARQTIDFTTSTASTSSNAAIVTFPTATASWGTITHIGLLDATTGGNMLFYTVLSTSRTIASGQQLKLKVSAITITAS